MLLNTCIYTYTERERERETNEETINVEKNMLKTFLSLITSRWE